MIQPVLYLCRRHSVVFLLLAAAMLAACGTTDRPREYELSREVRPLEMPPELARPGRGAGLLDPELESPGATTFSEYTQSRAAERDPGEATGGTAVTPEVDGVRLRRDGGARWLEVAQRPEVVWGELFGFWNALGIGIDQEEPRIGVMETEWLEYRMPVSEVGAAPPRWGGRQRGGEPRILIRDRYRVRLERGDGGDTTELFLTHRTQHAVTRDDRRTWRPRPADPELEAEMLSRFVQYLGGEEGLEAVEADTGSRARLTDDAAAGVALELDDGVAAAWRRTGMALDRLGYTVVDREPSAGLYHVRLPADADTVAGATDAVVAAADGGAGGNGGRDLRVRVAESGSGSRVTVTAGPDGSLPESAARRVLSRLQAALEP